MGGQKTITEVTAPKSRMSTNSIMPAYHLTMIHNSAQKVNKKPTLL